jgi:hypothetical protein
MKDSMIRLLGGVPMREHNEALRRKSGEITHLTYQLEKKGAVIDESEVFFTVDLKDGPKQCCDEDTALAFLLARGVCFVSGQDYIAPWDANERTCAIVVNCNDLFWWGTADAEPLPQGEIEPLYRAVKASPRWGADKWCCLRRKFRPQVPVVKRMKEDGFWDAELEALPAPSPS